MEYLRILGTENTAGGKHLATRVEGAPTPPGHAPYLVGPTWVPSTYSSTHPLRLPPEKNPHPAQARVLARFAAIFDLLAQTSIHKTALGDCCLVCDSSNGPVSFSSLYLLRKISIVVTLFLSLHVKFIWSKVVLMHDIASRHLCV